jgi:hypothetical protein
VGDVIEGQRQIRLDVGAAHRKARTGAWTSKSAEEGLEEVAEPTSASSPTKEIAEVARLHPSRLPARRRRKVCTGLPARPKLVIALPLLRVR